MTGDLDADAIPPALREEYLAGARDQLARLALLAERLGAQGNDPLALAEFRREVHKMHGSAGSFGFDAASRLAAGMEATAKDWVLNPADRAAERGPIARWFVAKAGAALGLGDTVAAAAAPIALEAPAPPPTAQVPDIIVVEDDTALAELLDYGLRTRGYAFAAYRNGRDALDALRRLEVGDAHPLLLLDVDLPGLDGYTLFDTLQRERPGVFRVVFTTVHGAEEEQLRGLETGALDYLVKPISLRVALEKIRRWVGR